MRELDSSLRGGIFLWIRASSLRAAGEAIVSLNSDINPSVGRETIV